MKFEYIFLYLSMIFWIFPAIRQYRTELFGYFLVYALTDPLSIVTHQLMSFTYHDPIYSLFNFLLLFSILWLFKYKYSIRILIAVVFSLSLFSFFSDYIFEYTLSISIHLIITAFFIRRTFIFIANYGKVNIFHLFLLLEEISIILKMSAVLISIKTGTIYYLATGAFEILIAIFFTIYREDNPKLHIDLRNA
jgi:hypothetical protein